MRQQTLDVYGIFRAVYGLHSEIPITEQQQELFKRLERYFATGQFEKAPPTRPSPLSPPLEQVSAPVASVPLASGVKRGRGRPPGAKNKNGRQ